MPVIITPAVRAVALGTAAAALMIGAFALGASRGSASSAGPHLASAQLTSSASATAKITVTGTGTVTGTPNQLTLAMGVQVNGSSVDSALQQASQAVREVTAALRHQGVAAADIQTTGLSVQPDYAPSSPVPDGYQASESLTATLVQMAAAGAQIQAAVHAGGNAATVDDISLDLADTSGLLATARARAVADARVKAAQYARALGQPLGPVLSISDQTPTATPVLPFANAAQGKAASVPISAGSQQLSVSVTVVYALA
jgi:uncharacterized protein